MLELKFVSTTEEYQKLKEQVTFTPEETSYYDELKERKDAQFNRNDIDGMIGFYINELSSIEGRFSGRIAVERNLKYIIGYMHESKATFFMNDFPPMDRSKIFQDAIKWYHASDELLGYYSDYCLRQAESCFKAANYRILAGFKDYIADWLNKRGDYLFKNFFNSLGVEPILINKPLPDEIKKRADVTIKDTATVYIFKDHTDEN